MHKSVQFCTLMKYFHNLMSHYSIYHIHDCAHYLSIFEARARFQNESFFSVRLVCPDYLGMFAGLGLKRNAQSTHPILMIYCMRIVDNACLNSLPLM